MTGSFVVLLVIPAIVFLYLLFIVDRDYEKKSAIKALLILSCFTCLFLVAIKNFFRGYNFLSSVFKQIYQDKGFFERVLIGNTISYILLILMIIFSVFVMRKVVLKK